MVAGTGIAAALVALARRRWSSLAQVVVSGMLACLLHHRLAAARSAAPGPSCTAALSQALDSAQEFAAPVPAEAPPIDPLLILCGLACLLLVDLLACTLRRVPLAGLPLLTIYSIPVEHGRRQRSPGGCSPATAAGFLTMLFLQESDQVSRWGRPLGLDRETGDPIAFGAGAHVVRGTAGTVGGVATALAVLVPALIPTARPARLRLRPGLAAAATTSGSTTRPPTWSATSSRARTPRWSG